MRLEPSAPVLLDTNILVYAFAAETAEHGPTRAWLQEQLDLHRGVYLSISTIVAFIRLVTHPRVLKNPAPMTVGFGFVRRLLSSARVSTLTAGERHAELLERLCTSLDLRGDDVPDAHLAALALENDLAIATHDRGFSRFGELRTIDPLD